MGEHQQLTTSAADEPIDQRDAASVVDVVVLIEDVKLLETLREASTMQHALRHAATIDAAIELLIGGRCGILIVDVALLQGDALNLLTRLQAQFPELIILATGRRDEEIAVAGAISDGHIYRFLHKPVSPARASLFLGAATRRYGELREVQAQALATQEQLATRPRNGRKHLAIAALIVAGALGLWWTLDRVADQNASRIAQTPEDHLRRAQEAFKAGRLSDRTDDNALALYRAALEGAPTNVQARNGIERVIAALDKRVTAALLSGDVVAARAALDELHHAHPAHPHLAGLNRQLQTLATQVVAKVRSAPLPVSAPTLSDQLTAIANAPTTASLATTPTLPVKQALTDPAVRAVPLAPTRPTPQIDRASARLAASQLIAPVDDSAATYLRRARELGEDETRLKRVATDLGTRLIEQVRAAMLVGNLQQAQHDYAAARALDTEFALGLTGLEPLGDQVRQPPAAKNARPAADALLPASDLPRLREVAAVYPREAEVYGVEGWVDVDFSIDTSGVPRDFKVRASQPRGTFDNAALDALREWRFAPVVRNGKAIVQPTTLRLDFTLKK